MDKVLLLSAPLVNRIWGGTYFKDVLKVTDSDEAIGEMWTVSGLSSNESIILNGTYQNQRLSEVYKTHPELFANPTATEFPILVKVIASSDRLSVQVHPNDEYAAKVENGVGKTEGWLILDHEPHAQLVVGHNAHSIEEIKEYVAKDAIEDLLTYKEVQTGEFYPIYSGTIHAIGKGIVLLEVQQSSDITYRLYDYHRKDKYGNERETHVAKALDVVSLHPYDEKVVNCFKDNIETIWDNQYFKVKCYEINDKFTLLNETYSIVTVIEGSVNVDGKVLTLGNSFIVTANAKEYELLGNGKVIVTTYK